MSRYYKVLNQKTKHEVFRSRSINLCLNYVDLANRKWINQCRFSIKADGKGIAVTDAE